MLKRFAWSLVCGLLVAASVTPAWSQDKKKAAPTPPPAEKKADDEKKSDEKSEEAAAEPKGPAAQKFTATYDKWKEVLKQLRTVRNKYQAAEAAEQETLKKDWDRLIGEADAMLPDLRKDAMAAYDEAPNLDSTLTRFLVKLLSDDVARDDYEAGTPLADLLIKNGCDFKQVYNSAGIIAFVNND